MGVSLWDHVEEDGVVQDLVVEGEVVGWNDVDTGFLLQLPVLFSDGLTDGEKGLSVDLTLPVGFGVLLKLSERANSWETKHSGGNHLDLLEKKRGKGCASQKGKSKWLYSRVPWKIFLLPGTRARM